MLFNILALISLLIVTLLLRRMVGVFPSLMACMIRWKENVNLQASLKLRTDRDMLTFALLIPFCLTVHRFRLYDPQFLQDFGDDARLGLLIAIFTAYLLLRIACRLIFRQASTPKNVYKGAADSARTFFIVLSLLLLAVGGVLAFLNVNNTAIKDAMICISGAIYAIFLIRKTQIFYSSCSIFVSFLYLCALEILPTGVLIASAVIF